jgi:hypothetical protein
MNSLRNTLPNSETELAAFQAVCQRLGITIDVQPLTAEDFDLFFAEHAITSAHWWLSLGQSHLFFDGQGRFLGTKWDDMGCWEPRQQPA